MKFYTDLHLHSYYSRATSKNLNLENLNFWGQLKGINLIGTGDFTHPKWIAELKAKLEPVSDGLFKLKKTYAKDLEQILPVSCRSEVFFMLTVEISNIYKRLDKVRKVHNVVFVPSFEAADKLIAQLNKIGNLASDGRPILGLDSRNLLEIVLGTDPLSYLIPAHIWTPWFSALGSKSGFDRIEDCFADLTPYIFAVETGLSSDPLMNWRLKQLDRFVLVSNGDAHSPQKLGREATIFDTELSYPAIYHALKDSDTNKGLVGTIEFFPEEGKYHYDGHRLCKIRLHPQETIKNKGLCPGCGKPVTVGVMARVEELADAPEGRKSPKARPYFNLVPLVEVIAESKDVGATSKNVTQLYHEILSKLGNEMHVLMDCPIEKIKAAGGSLLAEGINRMRQAKVHIDAGYDGEYGTIKLFTAEERETLNSQDQLLLFK